ncbi:hypothetical protein ED236_00470 [Pseudomethylobacillus aquaticus]|uniref:Uncharacterized protein n=1 Tax=Pseudomethylobacillus aquaticus TaxID=2676064 RepID=A0A3N0V5Y0_9PROT|nr:hypothetical protein [Pseudomethylobacillus aquaticus]ROH88002.1 hypothetical protein ED236_00470 [Pseudomethylobacillus aquaticus]
MYDNPSTVTFQFGNHDFGAGAAALSFKLPKGKSGRLIDVGVMNISEAFTATTTPAYVRVGTGLDPDAYAQLSCGTTAIGDTVNTVDDTDAIIDAQLPADTQIEVALVAPTGGTPAGIGTAFVVVEVY